MGMLERKADKLGSAGVISRESDSNSANILSVNWACGKMNVVAQRRHIPSKLDLPFNGRLFSAHLGCW
jgi:hypothetical protein